MSFQYIVIEQAKRADHKMVGTLYRRTRYVNGEKMQRAEAPDDNNPLGRIMLSVKAVAEDDKETIQYKLDEAILKEIPRLEYGHSVIKLFAAIGPMLGLLGTLLLFVSRSF